MKYAALLLLAIAYNSLQAQQPYYDATVGQGFGFRFWQAGDVFKIHMGNSAEYHYGPVTDYSIKTNMDGTPGRGWTWGGNGLTPVAALSNLGNMQIAGAFYASSFSVGMALNSRKFALWDDPNNWYGIGIQGGQLRFQVATGARFSFFQGDTGEIFTLKGSGEVGIGTTSPNQKLNISGASTNNVVAVRVDNTDVSTASFAGIQFSSGISSNVWQAFARGGDMTMGIANVADYLVIKNGGNIGIGTASPDAKLSVVGQVHATEVKVTTTVPGPDYVFDKSYDLRTLSDVKSYLDQNKHLPEVPSAAEMEKNGIQLGEMNMLLLKKIEELTLYLIEMKKENESVKAKMEQLESKLNRLKKNSNR